MIFGRQKLLTQICKILKTRSILFTGERRIGKTYVLDELQNNPPDNMLIIYSDLEKITSPLEFVNEILTTAQPLFNKKDKTKSLLVDFIKKLGGVELAGLIKIPESKKMEWKNLLEKSLTTICSNTESNIVFLWDEIPYMLQKINAIETANQSHTKSSLQILDTLRALRKEQPRLRMIFTGSIGLHHVINEITDNTYSSEPVNDMGKISIEPLTPKFAVEMIEAHLADEEITASASCIKTIGKECDYVPFYIEKLIRRLSSKEQKITPKIVKAEINTILTDAKDEWELAHFKTRLKIYYKDSTLDSQQQKIEHALIAKAILNHCALATQPQSIDDCHQAIKASFPLDDRDLINQLLNHLMKDHYLVRDSKGHYQFLFTLVQRWWILNEGLQSHD